ncbi:MAG: hypothetical protein UU77_C0008G0004 [candidate division WWE3 bacterium GW2011_GWC1_41_7]|uniref:Uncharacterized protein n=4 Tax=Katanobacteria TaxID=422282 RepID=A0A0G0XE07_UNCKA|nr:MAG: hypothetical protein UU72_C0007G0009 [candidate division WWE3 bacterium GW2011_GWB1_41_6]KKS21087.1 MAG: hypothetical protein UU77_C0008G0004 [candidate division WWE3 bacterium GW2011_GWC1_41_7]KKS22632.1 MAG: hypothetical protein UU80_C0004G0022 [candidate division WWE3 bacterium GW2011_GWA1_41_8]OGC57362.1 MAG: hypothetical protein A2976_02570 [candidate division WWE3 bacterium RIFCSPLOWO2_01_FULL_41_9]
MPGVIQKITGNIRKRTLKRVPKKTGHVIFFGNHKNGVVVRVEKEPNENSFYYLSGEVLEKVGAGVPLNTSYPVKHMSGYYWKGRWIHRYFTFTAPELARHKHLLTHVSDID